MDRSVEEIAEGLSEAGRRLVQYIDSGKLAVPVALMAQGANREILNAGLTTWEFDSDGDFDDIGDLTDLGRAVAQHLKGAG
jgi:hypothetical protein